jgi:hypothetical protein
MESTADPLRKVKYEASECWIPTYDDTLSRYHHFRARQHSRGSKDWRIMMQVALDRATAAKDTSPEEDPLFQQNFERLIFEMDAKAE